MAKYHRTEGVCLRRTPYGNTSQVACFLTPDCGLLSFIAKGLLRAPKRGISTGFELLGAYELVYTQRRSGSLLNLTERSLLEAFRGMGESVERILCGYYAAELMLNFTTEAEPCQGLYGLLLACLRRFEKGENLGLSVLLLEMGALRHYGACPTFDTCAECSGNLPTSGRLLFSHHHGGPLCTGCGRRLYPEPHPRVTPVKAERLSLLSDLACREAPPQDRTRLEPREIVAASRLLRLHMRNLLGKNLRMWKYLHGRHLSRSLRRIRRKSVMAGLTPPPS